MKSKPAPCPHSSELLELHFLARSTRRQALADLSEDPSIGEATPEALHHLGAVLRPIPSLIDIEERLLRIVQEAGAAPIPDTRKKASAR